MYKIIIVSVILIALFLIFGLGKNQQESLISSNLVATVAPTVTPFPFEELTIPYLRSRSYSSNLGGLEKVSENSSYRSYITYYQSDGLKINGQLTIPKGDMLEGGWPAVVFIHGYIPPTQYQTLGRYTDHVDFLARNNLVVFKIDLRGHANSEGEAGGGYYSSDYIIDVLNARAALQGSDLVNKDKIGLWGHSMAGNVILRTLAVRPEIPAAVIWAGAGYTYSDISEYGIDDNSYQPPPQDSERQRKRRELFEKYGSFNPDSPFWKQVAPTNYLSDLKGVIQLNHAINDNVVSIEYSRNLDRLLTQTKIPHEIHEYQSGGHNITGLAFSAAMQNTVDFFNRHLR